MENQIAPALAALLLRSGLSFWTEQNPQAPPIPSSVFFSL
ncbi:hypothetical protein SCH4B_0175 [Ruegeria sp. TrichCH4B]|nr:hypothetical protein SCH4B_0175 [Ruegeria sp. TrichCH4B]